MSIRTTSYVLYDDVILFLRKHLRPQVAFDNAHELDRFDEFYEHLGYDNPSESLKSFAFDFAWSFAPPERIEQLEVALEILIQDPFSNFIIHCSPNPHHHYVPMSHWERHMDVNIGE